MFYGQHSRTADVRKLEADSLRSPFAFENRKVSIRYLLYCADELQCFGLL